MGLARYRRLMLAVGLTASLAMVCLLLGRTSGPRTCRATFEQVREG